MEWAGYALVKLDVVDLLHVHCKPRRCGQLFVALQALKVAHFLVTHENLAQQRQAMQCVSRDVLAEACWTALHIVQSQETHLFIVKDTITVEAPWLHA